MGADVLLALQNPLVWLGLGIAVWGGTAILRWAASGGRLPLRGRRGSASALAGAGLAVQALYQPGAKQIQEMQQREQARREDDDEGDPPKAGALRPAPQNTGTPSAHDSPKTRSSSTDARPKAGA